jgi:hypothetical protein
MAAPPPASLQPSAAPARSPAPLGLVEAPAPRAPALALAPPAFRAITAGAAIGPWIAWRQIDATASLRGELGFAMVKGVPRAAGVTGGGGTGVVAGGGALLSVVGTRRWFVRGRLALEGGVTARGAVGRVNGTNGPDISGAYAAALLGLELGPAR